MGFTMIRPRRRDLFLLLSLAGVVPAFVTNVLPTTTWLPGVEGFRWAWFDLGATRWVFVALLLAAGLVGASLRPRWLGLALLPLLALVLTPAARIGAAEGPLHWIEQDEPDPALEAERQAGERLREPGGRIDTWLARLPPTLPDAAAALEPRWQPLEGWARAERRQLVRLRQERERLDALAAVAPPEAREPMRKELERQHAQLRADEERYLRDVAAAPPPPATALWELRIALGLHELWQGDKRARWLELPYRVASTLLVLAVVATLGIGHRVTLGFVGLALAVSLASAAARLEGGGTALAIAALQPVFVGTLALLVLRVLVRGWLDNREIWRSTEGPVLRRALAWSLLLWSPFALVLAANFWAGAAVASRVEARIYCPSGDAEACAQTPGEVLVRNSDPARDTLREDLQVALARSFATIEQKAIGVARQTRGTVGQVAAQVREGVLRAYDEVLLPSLFAYPGMPVRPRCHLFDPIACLANIPFDAAEAAYQRPRDRTRAALDQRVAVALGAVDRAAATASNEVQAALRGQAVHALRLAREQADATLVGAAGVAAFGNAALLFVAARAFLLILARLLFAQNKHVFMTLTPREKPLAEQATPVRLDVPAGDELHMSLAHGRLLMKPAFDVDGAAPNTLWLPPQPWCAPLARIRHGCWFLKEIEAPDASGGEPLALTLKSTPGTNFFCWDVPEGAEVAFRWDRFAGMSGSVRVRRIFSLKLGTLVLGHVTVAAARGPGLLVQHAYTRASAERRSVAQARVVGWVVGTRFRVESGKSRKNVYVDHCHVVCAEPGLAVHEAAREGRGGHGMWKELVGLLRP
ncbi:MAG: hypothetical protein KIT17_06430 [Rubrivivax sp.]|nr:hypothetical protein [Rubrivivax sp.]